MTRKAQLPSPQTKPRCQGRPPKTLANIKAQRVQEHTTFGLRDSRREGIADLKRELRRLRALAKSVGLHVETQQALTPRGFNELGGGQATRGMQLRFFQGRWCVADYWPATGTLLIGGIRRNAETMEQALRMVAAATCSMPGAASSAN